MKDWYSGMYKGLILAGIIAFIIGSFSSGSVSMDAYIAGYSALILGIMLILIILIYGITWAVTAMKAIVTKLRNTTLKKIFRSSGTSLQVRMKVFAVR